MKGASAEPAVTAISPPNTRKMTSSGASQSFFRSRMYAQRSRRSAMTLNVRYLLPPFHIEPDRGPHTPTAALPVTRHLLGISAYYHDSAACLLADGAIVAAAQEERFSRLKGDAGFPTNAVRFCL